ncbi:hypothetical protein Ddye_001506 [Dipteronia dyeriana]|uniref:Reverse transcriptase/retrotransposon-derived protein RNase H-like domain-containing protein n=1 Tax=Dipteronia dyeriana TaxID=168575 RepID=A0AAD9XP62_9ROSI|nr:hypothetical protein Ddye_001506 [Dipteronia dyeriana]
MSEMSVWLDLHTIKRENNTETILREFVSRFTRSLRDWYQDLGEYRQLQLVRCGSVSQAMGILFREFIGDASQFYKQTRQEFFEIRCCSRDRREIYFHYRRMSFRYHALSGINDESLRDFIPHASLYTTALSSLLKKNPPYWDISHTKAVVHLKSVSQKPLPLHIPSLGQLILQTDASDHFWAVIFIEEIKGKCHYYSHAGGQFKDAQKHYHTVYKEILAVKNGISKFDFHLRTKNFIIEMDNSSFPKVLEFRNKLPPNP